MYSGGKLSLNLVGFLILLLMWHFTSLARASPSLPQPTNVLITTWELLRDGILTEHIFASLKIILIGITIAVVLGFSLGILMFRYTILKLMLLPLIESIRGIAALTLFPLLIVLFGIGTFSRVFVISWTAWPAVVLSTLHSLQIDEYTVEAAKVCGAGEWRVITSIRIPIALPNIFTGIRIGVSGGWIGLVAAEMLGATRGLGYFLLWSSQSFQFERVYATIIVIASIGGVINFLLLSAQKNLTKF